MTELDETTKNLLIYYIEEQQKRHARWAKIILILGSALLVWLFVVVIPKTSALLERSLEKELVASYAQGTIPSFKYLGIILIFVGIVGIVMIGFYYYSYRKDDIEKDDK